MTDNPMKTPLLQCPFCGETEDFGATCAGTDGNGDSFMSVECHNCGASAPIVREGCHRFCYDWNTRTDEELRNNYSRVCAELSEAKRQIMDYEEVLDDKRFLTRRLDVEMNGEEGAAKQASLCDLVSQAEAFSKWAESPAKYVLINESNKSLRAQNANLVEALKKIEEISYEYGDEALMKIMETARAALSANKEGV